MIFSEIAPGLSGLMTSLIHCWPSVLGNVVFGSKELACDMFFKRAPGRLNFNPSEAETVNCAIGYECCFANFSNSFPDRAVSCKKPRARLNDCSCVLGLFRK